MPEIEVFSKLRGVGAVSQRMERFGFGKLPQHFTIYYTLKHLLKGNPDLNVCVTIKRKKNPHLRKNTTPMLLGDAWPRVCFSSCHSSVSLARRASSESEL